MDRAVTLDTCARRAHALWRRAGRGVALRSVDLFCRVIDNLGDAGVAVRLARQLVVEHGMSVRLFIDDASALINIAPEAQRPPGLRVLPWQAADNVTPSRLVIATFSCRLPARYLSVMTTAAPRPIWMNLEYLSAEPWVQSHHLLPSKHPQTGLVETFFYPGFEVSVGGLLRERGVVARADATRVASVADAAKRVSLFAYPTPAVGGLIDAFAQQAQPVEIGVPPGKLRDQLALTSPRVTGTTTLTPVPMRAQDQYDQLLASCTLNVVRGEDSFVRAHWAGRPFLWHIYPQADDAHLAKLDAWLAKFRPFVPTAQLFEAICALHHAWSAGDAAVVHRTLAWLLVHQSAWEEAVLAFRSHLLTHTDCTTQLLEFAKQNGFGLE